MIFEQLVLGEAGLDVGLDAPLLEDLDGGGGEFVGDEHAGGMGCPLERRWPSPPCGRRPRADGRSAEAPSALSLPLAGEGWAKPTAQGVAVSLAEASSAATVAKAQSSQGVSASTSEVSTVAPHQMRRPGGASR